MDSGVAAMIWLAVLTLLTVGGALMFAASAFDSWQGWVYAGAGVCCWGAAWWAAAINLVGCAC